MAEKPKSETGECAIPRSETYDFKFRSLIDNFPADQAELIIQFRLCAAWYARGVLDGRGYPVDREAREVEATEFGLAYGLHVMTRREPFKIQDTWRMWSTGDRIWVGI